MRGQATNPDTNRFEPLTETDSKLFRPDGTPVPSHWSIFKADEIVSVKNYSFKVLCVGEKTLLLEPVGPYLIGGFCDLPSHSNRNCEYLTKGRCTGSEKQLDCPFLKMEMP